jgi:ribonuclease P protein component
MSTPCALVTLQRRAEFLRVRGGGRAATPRLVLEGKARVGDSARAGDGAPSSGPRFGFTVTKKLGNAVTRNRIKRRLRAALASVAGQAAHPEFDYVIVARTDALDCAFLKLVDDFELGFRRVHKPSPSGKPAPKA